jgi:membrane protein DedA with SNARE-associated domain
MRLRMNTTASKVVASIAVWFVVFLVLGSGGFTFSQSEDWRWTTLGGLLLAAAAALSVLICSSRAGRRRERRES